MFETIMPRSAGRTTCADDVFDPGDILIADFKARAAGHLDIDDELSGIGARKVGTAQEREEARPGPARHRARITHGREPGPDEHPLGQSLIALQHALEVSIESFNQPLEDGNLFGLTFFV